MNNRRYIKKQKLTLAQYVQRRNGVPLGAPGALKNMFNRSLGAGSFAKFWQYWNPVFGYYLGSYIYAPLKRWLPPAIALIITFVACGALHDAVAIMLRGSMVFLFTPWFLLMGTGVVIGHAVQFDYSEHSWFVRALINIGYVGVCLVFALMVKV